ncbi:carboxylesterase/lipase family protein [Paralcaligenes ginsengisoli]
MDQIQQNADCHLITRLGAIKGSVIDNVRIYRGVPYATSMVGERRFSPPDPIESWQGEYDATRDRPIAPQNKSRLAAAMGDFALEQDEDCLTLNICAPNSQFGKHPVMVWIHGGAFTSGAGSLPWYSGEHLARNGDVITVGINYRLGALGFLYLPGLSDGNLGLKDQLLALQWVKDNIEDFGGDPDNITLVGQSAGGASIAALLTKPGLDGLFKRAVLQSASLGRLFSPPEAAEKTAHSFLKILGINPQEAHKLKQLPVAQLLAAQQSLGIAEHKLAQTKPPFWLVRDGEFIASELLDSLDAGRSLNVDLLIGTTREEMAAFYHFDAKIQSADNRIVDDLFHAEFGDNAAHYLNSYRQRRAKQTPAALLGDLYTDKVFRRDSLLLAERFSQKGLASYVYEFDWQSPNKLEACHCLEIPFVFKNLEHWVGSPMLEGLDREEFHGLSSSMQKAWVAFAHCGNPNHPGIPQWDQYTATGRNVMHFGSVIGPQKAHIIGDQSDHT